MILLRRKGDLSILTVAKEKKAIERIKMFDPIANGFDDKPYFVGYSGGKDSEALRVLFELSGVKHDLVHNLTTVDAPDTIYHIRSIPNMQIAKPTTTMWDLIVKNGMPPTRVARYCCRDLKEHAGDDRVCAFGIRWAESSNRSKKRGVAEVTADKVKDKLILTEDNTESRKLFENCTLRGKKIVNPIIDWLEQDVWYFLGHYGVKVNPLYEHFTRVGCIGCPMGSVKQRLKQFELYPKLRASYVRAFDRMIKVWAEKGKPRRWETGEDVMTWWIK